MCDIQTAMAVSGCGELAASGSGKMDMDKETVQAVAIVAGTVVAVTALIVDGEIGMAVAMGMMPTITGVAGYLFGIKRCENETEVPK